MPILTRKVGESIAIGDGSITVSVMEVKGRQVRLGISAPVNTPIHRQEIFLKIKAANQQASFKVQTTRFGEIEVPAAQLITLPHGMVGFPCLTCYVIMEHRPGSPFHWLQSLDRPDLAFVIMDPLVFDPAYQLVLGDNEAKLLQVGDPHHIQVWVVVTIPQGTPEEMTANFKAPLVINLQNRLAAQIILEGPYWQLRQPLKQ